MKDTYIDDYTCAYQDTMICYRDEAKQVRVPATAAWLELRRLGSQALNCPNAKSIELAEGYESFSQDLFNGLIRLKNCFDTLLLPTTLKLVEPSVINAMAHPGMKKVSLRRRLSQREFDSLLDGSLSAEGGLRLPAGRAGANSACGLMADVLKCLGLGVLDPAETTLPLFEWMKEEGRSGLFSRKRCMLPEGMKAEPNENSVLLKCIAGKRWGVRDTAAEQWSDRMMQLNMNRPENQARTAVIWFDERAISRRGDAVYLSLEAWMGVLFRQAIRRVRLNGFDYYVYSRHYFSTIRSLPAYQREDVCVYDARGLVTDPEISEEVYEKYRLLNVL